MDPKFYGYMNMLINAIEKLAEETAKLSKTLEEANKPPKED